MSDKKTNNDFHWKSKLEDLESLPGETFSKEAAWDKLHARMQGKKSRNIKAFWHGVAAACLLLAFFTSWFLTGKKESAIVKNNSAQQEIQSSSSHILPPVNQDIPAVISSLPAKKKMPPLSAENGNKIKSLFNHNTMQVKNIQEKKEKEGFTTINNNAVAPVDSAIGVIAILPEKKKLKVVHINELGNPVAESPNIARNYEHHLRKIINPGVYTSPPSSSANTAFSIFKIKTPPSN